MTFTLILSYCPSGLIRYQLLRRSIAAMDRIHCNSIPSQAALHRNATGYGAGIAPLTDTAGRAAHVPNASQVLDMLCHGVIITDVEGRVVYMNRRAEMIIGRTHKQVLGNSIVEALIGAEYQLRGEGRVRKTEVADEGLFTVQLQSCGSGGRLVEVRVVPLFDEFSADSGELYEIHDVSESAQHTKQLIYAATHDPVTELANKTAFMDSFKRHFEADADSRAILALLYLDGFKRIYDECGRLAGDEVLRDISHCLGANTRQTDIVARLDSDEFAILLVGCDLIEARTILEKIRADVSAYRYCRLGQDYALTLSIGITTVNPDAIDAADILKSVDQACERAKSSGGDRIVVERQFNNPVKIISANRSIRQSLFNEKHYRLYQQSIFSLHAANTIRRIDVLLRLLDKDRIIMPHEFMPDVKRYGLESELDQWVLTALANAWANRYSVSDSRPMQCFINLSTSSIAETESTIDYLSDLIAEYQLPDGLICLNIQESQVIECETQVAELTQCLAGKGVKFALDGVGAGQDLYSLGYLKDIPVDYIKLSARALVKSADDTVYAAYVQALTNISRVLDVSLIGVGTEGQDDLRHFKELKVDYVQGHALSAPEPFSLGWIGVPARTIQLHSVA